MSLDLFIPITKVDESQRLVYGVVAEEVVDHSGELFDYESSKPNFQKWSEDAFRTSNGKSKGNLRTMHGKVAAGKLTDIGFDDNAKRVSCVAKVVDDGEWKKVLEGVYTGFSMGGRYGNRWMEKSDDKNVTRYEAIPSEVSLVDKPCIPTATFELIKMDGHSENRMFKAFDESKVSRQPKGESGGGQFSSKDGGWHPATATEFASNEHGQVNYETTESYEEGIEGEIKRLSSKKDLGMSVALKQLESAEAEVSGSSGKLREFHERRLNFVRDLISRIENSGNKAEKKDGAEMSKTFEAVKANPKRESAAARIKAKREEIDAKGKQDEAAQAAPVHKEPESDGKANYPTPGGHEGNHSSHVTNEEVTKAAEAMDKAAGGDGSNWAAYLDKARQELTKSDEGEESDKSAGGDYKSGFKDGFKEGYKEDPEAHKSGDDEEGDEGKEKSDKDEPVDRPAPKDPEEEVKKADFGVHQVWATRDGKTFLKKSDALAHETELETNGSPLLKSILDLQNSIRPQADVSNLEKMAEFFETEAVLAKSMSHVSRLSDVIRCLASLQIAVNKEQIREGDSSSLPDSLFESVEKLSSTLEQMVAEETVELLTVLVTEGSKSFNEIETTCDIYSEYMELAASTLGLEKSDVVSFCGEEYLRKSAGSEGDKEDSLQKADTANTLQKSVDAMSLEVESLKAELAKRDVELGQASVMIKQVLSDVEAIKKLPMPSAPRTSVVDKESDSSLGRLGKAEVPDLTGLTKDELAKMAISLAQQNGHKIG